MHVHHSQPGDAAATTRPCRRWCALLVLVCACTAGGCVQEMEDQPRVDTYEASPLAARATSARLPVPGTVSRGHTFHASGKYDPGWESGKSDGDYLSELPERMLEDNDLAAVLERGRERYSIYCVHCHDLTGHGNGIVPQRGFPYPPSYHSQRLREQPIGYFFDVITNGRGQMAAHGGLVPVADRWAISAYIRALQLSQHAPLDELPEEDRNELNRLPREAADSAAEGRVREPAPTGQGD